ncbi:endonuclease/exonuclease/phosphatase [Polycladidibacter hongkongensis]|uniref:endonuclease/exonuclease/phosphatase n=1 Tax=Polycladidibacter hongkongensis TaxID=1647556 RepID=UPI00083528B3|nr:endonuclease/exonuclease/phosphatase [Pseudovibrio hongkongensis]
MQSFKLTSWNIEHADKLLDAVSDSDATKARHARARMAAIKDEISALGADVLLICEGPCGEVRARTFFDEVAPDYELVVRGTDDADAYGMQGASGPFGRQWIWFLLRKGARLRGQLLHLDQWQELTEVNSKGMHKDGSWPVSFPQLRDDRLEFAVDRSHSYWRHPQVLQLDVDGHFCEVIGLHLKSKHTSTRHDGGVSDDDFFARNPKLVAELIKDRTKISTECADVRHYIEQRFAAQASAAIIVGGDMNDGPAKERIERRFMYHDLLGGLQGDVFFARRFLNHALFDAPDGERWSVQFEDKLDPGRDPHILLDHVLFTQSFTNAVGVEPFAFKARRGGGKVEHEVHQRIAGPRPKYATTSDHRPISMVFDRR